MDRKSKWQEYLNTLLFTHSCTPHQTQVMPHVSYYLVVPRFPVYFKFGINKLDECFDSYEDFVSDLKQKTEYTNSLVRENMNSKAENFSGLSDPTVLKPGD